MMLPDIYKEKLSGLHQTIGYANPLTQEYKPMDVVKAFHSLLGSHPDWVLKVIGFGSEYITIQRYIKENGLQHAVHLFGPLSHKETFDVLKRTDILVVPSSVMTEADRSKNTSVMGMPMILNTSHPMLPIHTGHDIIPFKPETDNLADIISQTIVKLRSYDSSAIRTQRISYYS